MDQLIAAAKKLGRHGARDAAMIMVAYRHGLRVSELVALRWDQVDLEQGLLHVRRRKNGIPSTHPLHPHMLRHATGFKRVLTSGQAQRRGRRGPAPGDAPSIRWPSRTVHKDHMAAALNRIRKRAGLRKIGWHALRHSFASHLVMLGVPLKVVQELMRHQSIEMTMRYSHLCPGTRAAAVEVLVEGVHGRGTYAAHRGPKSKTGTHDDS
ncbi:tyrosine-type recombinase/integrase [Myxococcota bacterium]